MHLLESMRLMYRNFEGSERSKLLMDKDVERRPL